MRAARFVLPLVLVSAGFLAYVFGVSLLAEGESVRQTQVALMIYARTILVKGLVPQTLLALALLPACRRVLPGPDLPAVVASALAAALAVAALLLPLDLPMLPAVRYTGVWNFTATVLELTAAVAAAVLLSRWLIPKRG